MEKRRTIIYQSFNMDRTLILWSNHAVLSWWFSLNDDSDINRMLTPSNSNIYVNEKLELSQIPKHAQRFRNFDI
jgi:hypothetical protein